jgi:hypothetical protein
VLWLSIALSCEALISLAERDCTFKGGVIHCCIGNLRELSNEA